MPTSAPTLCVGGGLTVQVKITTDKYPSETSWTLTNECGLQSSMSGGPYTQQSTLHIATQCLPHGQYKFTINDTFGDGICCGYGSGSYVVDFDGIATLTGGAFRLVETKTFGTCAVSPTCPLDCIFLTFLCVFIL